jgi:SAM-dependent methyltransferase
MAKQGEIEYLRRIGEPGVHHSLNKPFQDPNCARYLMEVGAVLSLLPPPPARLLDVGCGTGWTSLFFARRGYEVVGIDISPDAIRHADQAREQLRLKNVQFLVRDYEDMTFEAEFDCAVFYDSLHHAVDEELALRAVHRSLKSGGICVTSEPGLGHSREPHSLEAMHKFDVTEKDMPPNHVKAVARRVGFREFSVYPHAYDFQRLVYDAAGPFRWPAVYLGGCGRVLRSLLLLLRLLTYRLPRSAIVKMTK